MLPPVKLESHCPGSCENYAADVYGWNAGGLDNGKPDE